MGRLIGRADLSQSAAFRACLAHRAVETRAPYLHQKWRWAWGDCGMTGSQPESMQAIATQNARPRYSTSMRKLPYNSRVSYLFDKEG